MRRLFIGGTLNQFEISYDPVKNAANVAAGRPSFDEAEKFEFETAVFAIDARRDYGEERIVALGTVMGRLHALVYVKADRGIRVISFRKANDREIRRYDEATRTG